MHIRPMVGILVIVLGIGLVSLGQRVSAQATSPTPGPAIISGV